MGGEGVPEGDAGGSAHDAVRADKPDVEPGEVHRPSAAARYAGGFAVKLCHDPVGGHTLGQGVMVAAVRSGHGVAPVRERCGHPDGRRLLAHGRVNSAGDLSPAS